MSAEDKDRKTEKPTRHKLREARKKGQVPFSKEVPTTLTLLFGGIYLWLMFDWMLGKLVELMSSPANLFELEFEEALKTWLDLTFLEWVFVLTVPLALLMFVVVLLSGIIQFGFVFSVQPLIPQYSKIDPVKGFERIFSQRTLVETLFTLIKLVLIGWVVYVVIRNRVPDLLEGADWCGAFCLVEQFQAMMWELFFYVMPLLLVLMVLDWLYRRYDFEKEQRMTKEELKRETKDHEGDPLLRGYRRSSHREMADLDLMELIPRARVVISDASAAVAVLYEPGITELPVVLAMGRGKTARQMEEIATSQGVPIREKPGLATLIADEGIIDHFVPDSALTDVAQILKNLGA